MKSYGSIFVRIVNIFICKMKPNEIDIKEQFMARKPDTVKIIPIGGMREIGKNMTVIEYREEIIVIDCGMSFPDDDMPGIDVVIPDISYLEKNASKIKGVVITHGHEDHIGNVPYFLKKIDAPIYATDFPTSLIKLKLKEHRINNAVLNVVTAGSKVRIGQHFAVDFIRVNHSIPDACALAIHTPVGVIVHSGDFKVDFTPVDGEVMDFYKLAEIGKKGCLCMLCESTNVERKGFTISEKEIGKTFEKLFQEGKEKRIIVATFSSNVHRIQQIVDYAVLNNRKVCIVGRSMVNAVNIASETGYLNVPKNVLINLNELNRYDDNRVVIITTGSQGEPMAALSRMAAKEHRNIQIEKTDMVIVSAHPIPGNEKSISKVIDQLYEIGADVVYDALEEVHVSGHAKREELKLMHRLVKPQFFVPCHGEFRMLKQHKELAMELGMNEENIHILDNGDVLELSRRKAVIGEKVQAGRIFVDGLGVGDVGNIVLRDRKHLAEDGLMVVVITVSKENGRLVSEPDIISRGFVYVRESEELMSRAKEMIRKTLDKHQSNGEKEVNWSYVKNAVRDELRKFLFNRTKRNPMILPIIIEA